MEDPSVANALRVEKGGFAFVPLGTPHTYTIHSKRVRMLGMSTPSDFGDHIEATGKNVRTEGKRRGANA